MKRLTERKGNLNLATPKSAYEFYTEIDTLNCATFCKTQDDCMICQIGECFDKLADYEDAEEKGRIVNLPVSLGSTIYEVIKETHLIYEHTVYGFRVDDGPIYLDIGHDVFLNSSKIGETLFLTRIEAEGKVSQMEMEEKSFEIPEIDNCIDMRTLKGGQNDH